MDYKLRDKTAVVTGAGGGIGSAIARGFCREGCRTVFTDLNADGLKKAVRGCGDRAVAIECDVSSLESVRRMFAEVREKFGALHILVNTAAVNTADWVQEIREEELQKIIDVNIKGYIYTTMEAVGLMRAGGFGRLIYINSGSGLKASAGLSLYSASKYFNRGFSISVALEVGKYNITANSICPSDVYPEQNGPDGLTASSWKNEDLVRISLQKAGVSSLDELERKRIASNPMKRACTRKDITGLALFLASESAGYINGQSIGLNGGALPY